MILDCERLDYAAEPTCVRLNISYDLPKMSLLRIVPNYTLAQRPTPPLPGMPSRRRAAEDEKAPRAGYQGQAVPLGLLSKLRGLRL